MKSVNLRSSIGWYLLLSIGIVWFFGSQLAYGHGGGFFAEKVVGDYLLDFGYSSEVLFEDIQVRFDFAIYDKDKNVEIDFSEVWVRIEKEDKLLFAGGLNKARFGPTGLAYYFSDGGNYKITTRFSNATTTLAEGEFDFVVVPNLIPLKEQVWFQSAFITSVPWLIVTLALALYVIFAKRDKKTIAESVIENRRAWLQAILNIFLFLALVFIGYLLASKASYIFELVRKFLG